MNQLIKYRAFYRFIFLLFIGMAPFTLLHAEGDEDGNSNIKGNIVTNEGLPAVGVTVTLKGTKRNAITDDDGNFHFKNISAGDYEIEVHLVGYEAIQKEVDVDEGKTVFVYLKLEISEKKLQEVIVTGNRYKLVQPTSDYVAKIPLKNLENSQVYTTITKDLLKQQMVYSVDDAVANATGIQKMWEATGRGGDGGAYYNSRGFILSSQLRNGVAGNITSRIDAANIESIEVIKGPSATLFGSPLTSYGGLINRVTKKPYDKLGGEISYSTGSYSFNRLSADFNTPLDSNKRILFRMNAAYNYEGTFQDNGFSKGYILAPSLTIKANDRLSFSFDAELYNGANTSKQFIFFYFPTSQLNATNPKELGIDYNRSYSAQDIQQVSKNQNYFAQMDYKISSQWRSQTNFSNTNSFSDGPYAYFYVVPNSVVTGNPDATGADYLARADQSTANSTAQATEMQQNFIGDFRIGNLRNRFVGGLDFFAQNSNQLFYGLDFDTIPKNGNIPAYGNFDKDNLNKALQNNNPWTYPYRYKNNTYSAYVSDVLNITDKLIASAAIRADHFHNVGNFDQATGKYSGEYEQTSFSPKFGLVYQPVKDKISLFANYQNGFTNVAGTDYKGKTFKPEQANQIEGGIKLNAFGGRLNGTISYYDIEVKDIVRPYAADPNFSIQDGTQLSKGIEAEIIAKPLMGLNVVAGFSYNDSKYDKADPDVQGRRPATAMSPYTANLWVGYSLLYGKAKGLGFGFGGNYANDNKIVNSVYYGVFTLPERVILNATVFFDQPKYRIGLKVDNLTNKEYWIGYTTMNPQKLRSVTGSISFKF
jgi:iron complex outermembrane receptor protein